MLKGINPLVSSELLAVLAEMGHGDDIAIVDRNFPASSNANRLITLPGFSVSAAARIVLELMPLDTFVEEPALRMAVVGGDGSLAFVQQEVLDVIHEVEGTDLKMGVVERFDFYEKARQAYAIIHTTEDRPYGCFILKKGVIF